MRVDSPGGADDPPGAFPMCPTLPKSFIPERFAVRQHLSGVELVELQLLLVPPRRRLTAQTQTAVPG